MNCIDYMTGFTVEEELVNNNFHKLSNIKHYYNWNDINESPDNIQHIWAYSKKENECNIITLDYDTMKKTWILSYPMKNTSVNYRALFNSKEEVNDYVKYVLQENCM
mgnify:CR=1 FL=1|jgi:hypothetical protein